MKITKWENYQEGKLLSVNIIFIGNYHQETLTPVKLTINKNYHN